MNRIHTFEGPFYGFETVVSDLAAACKAAGSQKAWAENAGLSQAYVNDVLKGRREPADTIAEALGYERFVIYRRAARVSDEHPQGEDPKGLRAKPASAVGRKPETPEHRARQTYELLISDPHRPGALATLTEAFREAENDAFERAAQEARDYGGEDAVCIALEIAALKHEEPL